MNLRVAVNSRDNCEILAPKKVKTVTFMNYENKNVAETELDLRVAENSCEIRDEVLVILRVAENNREIPEKVTFVNSIVVGVRMWKTELERDKPMILD